MRCGKVVHGPMLHSIWVDKRTTHRFTDSQNGLPEGTENKSGKCKLLPEQYLLFSIDLIILIKGHFYLNRFFSKENNDVGTIV